ncbi:MAG: transposase family protein [Nitrososphaerota archaeon]|nr:transposase family protein [Nitrososphaerota archaeon]
MQKILLNLQIIDNYDPRQQGKIKYKLNEIIALSFGSVLTWNRLFEIEEFVPRPQMIR